MGWIWTSHTEMKSSFTHQLVIIQGPVILHYSLYRERFFFLLGNPLDNAYSFLPIAWRVVFSPSLYFNLVQTLWWCVTGGPQLTMWCAHCTVGIPQWHSCKPNHESQLMVTTLYFNFPWELWPVSGLEPVRKLENCFQVLSVKIKTTCWALRRKKGIRVLVV